MKDCDTEMVAISDIEVLEIKKEDILQFLGKNPGMMLVFREDYIIE